MSDRCLSRHPHTAGIVCTRDKDHKGGHLDTATDVYWPAAAPAPAESDLDQAVRDARAADRLRRLADSIGARP